MNSLHTTSASGLIASLRKLPLSIFAIVLGLHLLIGGWLLSARFDLFSSQADLPIFVTLEANEAAGQTATQAVVDTTSASASTTLPAPLNQQALPSEAAGQVKEILAGIETPVEKTKPAPKPTNGQTQATTSAGPAPPARASQSDKPEVAEPDAVVRPLKGTQALESSSSVASVGAVADSGARKGPRLVSQIDYLGEPPRPVYPIRAKNRQQQGRVIVRVLVDSTGTPLSLELLKPSEFDLLNQAALEAVRQVRFKPYSENGVAYERLADIPIDFVLNP